MPENSSPAPAQNPAVPWNDVVRFVRQISHDLRNHLNAAELQSVFLNEIASDAEIKAEIKRLRQMISELGVVLQKLSTALMQPKPNFIPYRAADLMEDIQKKFESQFPDRKSAVQWQTETGESTLNVDPQLLQEAVFELLENAFHHGRGSGPMTITARTDGDRFMLALREPKTEFNLPTDNWGREPMRHVRQGHYGLGLTRLRAIVEAHGGSFGAEFGSTASSLTTTIGLPLPNSAS